ncbi:chemotaxis protein CheA [Mesorhizobium sp.]|jgi:two-component system chemotaxis sensor kinase CheA|uniref:chemotaxis protein CheA n=1 Tax=Mesorhizobium sp. TaxID=1871066 RepID=UPI003561BD45
MNELLEQFLVECRELVQQATLDLLAIESDAADGARLDSAFRSIHTLKGGAGIVDFPEMATGLHAVEDLLASARAGGRALGVAEIGNCLWALDRVTAWLDEIGRTGTLPVEPGPTADEMVRRFQATGHDAGGQDGSASAPRDLLAALIEASPQLAGQYATGVLYQPDPRCFFRGDDPLALFAGMPGLLSLKAEDVEPWPALAELDAFESNLRFAALSSAAPQDVSRYVAMAAPEAGQRIEIRALAATEPPARPGLTAMARRVLEAQHALLANEDVDGLAGRVGAARRVVMSIVARGIGPHDASTDRLERSIAGEQRGELQAVIGRILGIEIQDPPGADAPPAPPTAPTGTVAARSLRVSVERIDALVNLTGELSIARNALAHAAALARSGTQAASLAVLLDEQQTRLDRLVGALQRSVMSIRVLPMRQVFQRFPRLVRDLAAEMGKSVALVTEGDDTEADKTIVEALAEPILHVVRNAIDHGLETAEERVRAGKPPQATISMRAAKVGDSIAVEIEDDGKGVDLARVRRIAAERGLTVGAPITDADTLELLFKPGFSTAATVSTISGRGVGMDAVRAAVEGLGGSVGIETEAGLGTLVTFTLPYSILMTPLITVEAAGQIFGIPLDKIVETRRLARADIAPVGKARVFVHRGRAIPLVNLEATIGGTPPGSQASDVQVVVVMSGNDMCGIEVDRLGEKMDILMRPVEGVLAGLQGIAGVTILGDGRVMLVLDLEAMLG